jgi:hypothetical protein
MALPIRFSSEDPVHSILFSMSSANVMKRFNNRFWTYKVKVFVFSTSSIYSSMQAGISLLDLTGRIGCRLSEPKEPR